MTRKEARDVLAAVAELEPRAPSVELTPHDRSEIREQIAAAIAPALGMTDHDAVNRMEAIRMSA